MAWHLKLLVAASLALLVKFDTAFALSKQKIILANGKNKRTISVEVAKTMAEQSAGLMHRKSLPADQGMLFVFAKERILEFWMKNTLIDLDIAYISKERKVIDIQQMKAQQSVLQTNHPTYPSKAPAQYALEMNVGWFKKNKFPEGTSFEFVSGPSSK